MSSASDWMLALGTIASVAAYEAWLAVMQHRRPRAFARSSHASLREDWFAAVSLQPGSEVLAVQTLRNALMSASLTASTAVLALMGTITLAAPALGNHLRGGTLPDPSPRIALELVLLSLLLGALVASTMAVRFYNHAGFVGGMPVNSAARRQWTAAGSAYVRRAGLFYSWGLRHLVLVVPVVAAILYLPAGPVAGVLVAAVLFAFDRTPA